jgi:hypothetical protein
MPRDVREYIIRRHFKAAVEAQKTVEQRRALSTEMMSGALGLEDEEISMELRDELIKTAFELLDKPVNPLSKPPE